MASRAVRDEGVLWGAIVSLLVILAICVVNHAPSKTKEHSSRELDFENFGENS